MPKLMSSRIFHGADIFTGETILEKHAIIVDNGYVQSIKPVNEINLKGFDNVDLHKGLLAPGFVDIQVNGGGDCLFNDETNIDGLIKITRAHRQLGCTAILPTIISDTNEVMHAASKAINQALTENLPGILGIHFEGPAFSGDRNGAHQPQNIRSIGAEEQSIICAIKDGITLLTFSPDQIPPSQIKDLCEQGILLSIGHSSASYEECLAAIKAGANSFTHLFNAMTAISARSPGPALAALDTDQSYCGIICDGHHVHPSLIKLALDKKPKGKLLLVSDAMPVVGGEKNYFDLYNERLKLQNGKLINQQNRLAGAAIGLIDAVRYMVNNIDCELEEALKMASVYPAQFLGLEKTHGSIKPGSRADFVHLSDTLTVENTWVLAQDHF